MIEATRPRWDRVLEATPEKVASLGMMATRPTVFEEALRTELAPGESIEVHDGQNYIQVPENDPTLYLGEK